MKGWLLSFFPRVRKGKGKTHWTKLLNYKRQRRWNFYPLFDDYVSSSSTIVPIHQFGLPSSGGKRSIYHWNNIKFGKNRQ